MNCIYCDKEINEGDWFCSALCMHLNHAHSAASVRVAFVYRSIAAQAKYIEELMNPRAVKENRFEALRQYVTVDEIPF